MLTQSELKNILSYDKDSGIFTWIKTKNIAGCKDNLSYIIIRYKKFGYRAHRLAWLYIHGEFPKLHIDHINGITSDNRICNLREVTSSENMQNQKKPMKTNTVGFLGVSKCKNKYKSTITLNGKSIHLGYFFTPEKAHEAYVLKKREIHIACTI